MPIFRRIFIILISTSLFSIASSAHAENSFYGLSSIGTDNIINTISAHNNFHPDIRNMERVNISYQTFCSGNEKQTASFVVAGREMFAEELNECKTHGVETVAIPLGYFSVVIVKNKDNKALIINQRNLFAALFNDMTLPNGSLLQNKYQHWRNISADLPDVPIQVYGPPMKESLLFNKFQKFFMIEGCKAAGLERFFSNIADLRKNCEIVRSDGKYVPVSNDTLALEKLASSPNSLTIVNYVAYKGKASSVDVMAINNILPSDQTIISKQYAATDQVFVYVKKAHLDSIATLKTFTQALLNLVITGPEAIYNEIGLLPLSNEERKLLQGKSAVTK